MDKVSVSQLGNHGFEPYTGHGHDSSLDTFQYLLVPGSGLESDLNMLWDLASQSSYTIKV